MLSAGQSTTCGITTAGVTHCWGLGTDGRIGNGSTDSQSAPTSVSGSQAFVTIDTSGNTCALNDIGVAYCWGSGQTGQIGDGALGTRTTPSRTSEITPPATTGNIKQFVSGAFHNCALRTDGAAYCWGNNSEAQMGDGTSTSRTSPVAVTGGHTFKSIHGGSKAWNTCAIKSDGTGYCWGSNTDRQSGNNSFTHAQSPVAIVGGHLWKQLAPALRHTCGITVSGAAYCWGTSSYGELGGGGGLPAASGPPKAVVGGLSFKYISTGSQFSCALTEAGAAYCWGIGSRGSLGDGYTSTHDTSTPVAVLGGHVFKTIALGGYHVCGLRHDGAAYCWGGGSDGRLGDGNSGDHGSPVPVSGGHTWQQITVGVNHSCGITTSGDAYCWGEGSSSELGDGNTGDHALPQPVSGGHKFTELHAAEAHTCGLTVGGAVYCWGGGGALSAIGDGATTERSAPVAVVKTLTDW
jgi:alpha-tubulin suppressor-like RCC1 family protein